MTGANERLRVLRIITRMNVGGPAWQATALTERLDPARFETRLVAGRVGIDEADYLDLRPTQLEVTRIDALGRPMRAGGDARAFAKLVGEIRRFRPHLVHTHTTKAGILGRLAAHGCRVPATVHTFHGHLLHGYSRQLAAGVRLTERALAGSTTRLVAVGVQVRDDLLSAGIGRPDQYVVIPPGVAFGPHPSRRDGRAALGLPPTGLVVALVARLTEVKRPDRFVDMVARVAPDHPEVTFVVAGGGALLEKTRALALSLGSQVHFLGWRADIAHVYAAADIVVLTSDNEGTPVSLIEASLAGRPCVTTRVGSAPEVVLDGATGFVTPPYPGALADAVRRLLDDPPLRSRFGEAAAAHAQARYGVDRLVADTERLYEEIALPETRRRYSPLRMPPRRPISPRSRP